MIETGSDALAAHAGEEVLDTRADPTIGCAALAMHAVDALTAGGSFVLVANHDPRGIHYMLDAERPGVTTWQALEEGPQRWQIRIAKASAAPH
jgi:uncharacterized protein (DUF2249 family)